MSAPPADPTPTPDALSAYLAWWAGLGPKTIAEGARHLAPEARFIDPFVDLQGRDAILHHLARSHRRLGGFTVEIRDKGFGRDGAFVLWTFETGRSRRRIDGMSALRFDTRGRVALHHDHWDAAGQVYETLPILGPLLRILRRRLG